MSQAWPLTQSGEIQGNLELEAVANRLLPRGYGEDYSAAVLDQLKAWEAYRSLGVCRHETPPMPTRDVTPSGCPRAWFYDRTPREPTGRPIVTAKVAEAACGSHAASSKTETADLQLQQHPVIQLPKMEEEELKGVSSRGSTRQPKTSTPKEGFRSRAAEAESMEVDTHAV